MSNILLSSPTLSGTMAESSLYNFMNVGLTDTLLLIGHADADVMYQPYQVLNAKKAVQFLNNDSKSPLLRAFLEAYNAGCRDIWLYPAAPMLEYQPTVALRNIPGYWGYALWGANLWGGNTFHEAYYSRLADAYNTLADYDFAEIIVPVEAIFYDSGNVDYLTQLANFCANSFITTGSVCLGIMGTRFPTAITQVMIDTMAADTRIAQLGNKGKFVLIAGGEGTVSVPQMSTTYVSNMAPAVASVLSTAKMDRSIAGILLPNVSALVGNDLSTDQLEKLAQAKINMVVRTARGRRGYAYQTRLNTDNTSGQDGSDFWSMSQMHIVANTINQIRHFGYAYIGTLYLSKFKEAVKSHLAGLVSNRYIRDYSLSIVDESHGQRALVYVSILPIFGVRQISFKVEVGPGI